ncbi:sensor histidine kinase [Alkalihalobacillus sp. AL-G]|uniref:sensor histidine kinase n=1 Tax=Alkalihalobacillus sp. AL-G TaxID=2926399 RepID=UPI00272A7FA3|nr:sensor histidine kinase [Alkalihalobacillus sp. AL-G]WLD93887.1 sensor histidine kinase [Alkalihalobacillus sp. AL-G]
MSIVQRQVMLGIAVSFSVLLLFSAVFFYAYPLVEWSQLWERNVFDLPFVLVVPALCVSAGLAFGVASGFYWRKNFDFLEAGLTQLQRGRTLSPAENGVMKTHELEQIWTHIEKVQHHIAEQTKLSQKLANEKAEDQEKQIQKMVSEERNRLARELHDSVSQQLFAASMLMSAVNESNDEGETKRKQLQLVEEMIHQSQLEMRALLLHLRPVALKGKSLKEGIEELLRELVQKVPIEIEWKVEELTLEKGIEDHLFRILQESVSNTLRHAKAHSLNVLCIQREDIVRLRVEDDGVGFNVETAKTGSYGLQNMHERAVELGGTMKIVSVPNKGTRLEVTIPMIREEEVDND